VREENYVKKPTNYACMLSEARNFDGIGFPSVTSRLLHWPSALGSAVVFETHQALGEARTRWQDPDKCVRFQLAGTADFDHIRIQIQSFCYLSAVSDEQQLHRVTCS
jgi:hypothetical protein